MVLRAGLVGLGAMGKNHMRVLSSMTGVELAGICDSDPSAHVPATCPIVSNLDDLLKEGIDYCVVAAPTEFHEDIGLALAKAGVSALIEKPLAMDGDSASRLADEFASRGLVGAVGHVERYNPALQQARRRIEAGELGQIFQVSTRRQGPFPVRITDVGVVKDLATHDIDLTAWITGQPYSHVSARTAFRTGRVHEDLVAVVGTLADGTVTSHLVNWLSPFKERSTVVMGALGAFVIDTLNADLTFYANGIVASEWDQVARFRGVSEGDVIRYAFPKPEPLRTQHEAFRDAMLGLRADIVTMSQGLATVRVADCVIESARSGQTVAVGGRT